MNGVDFKGVRAAALARKFEIQADDAGVVQHAQRGFVAGQPDAAGGGIEDLASEQFAAEGGRGGLPPGEERRKKHGE